MLRPEDKLKTYLETVVLAEHPSLACSLRKCERDGAFWNLSLSDDELVDIVDICIHRVQLVGFLEDYKGVTPEGAMLEKIIDLISESDGPYRP